MIGLQLWQVKTWSRGTLLSSDKKPYFDPVACWIIERLFEEIAAFSLPPHHILNFTYNEWYDSVDKYKVYLYLVSRKAEILVNRYLLLNRK